MYKDHFFRRYKYQKVCRGAETSCSPDPTSNRLTRLNCKHVSIGHSIRKKLGLVVPELVVMYLVNQSKKSKYFSTSKSRSRGPNKKQSFAKQLDRTSIEENTFLHPTRCPTGRSSLTRYIMGWNIFWLSILSVSWNFVFTVYLWKKFRHFKWST